MYTSYLGIEDNVHELTPGQADAIESGFPSVVDRRPPYRHSGFGQLLLSFKFVRKKDIVELDPSGSPDEEIVFLQGT